MMNRSLALLLASLFAASSCDRGEPGRIPPAGEVAVEVSPVAAAAVVVRYPALVRSSRSIELATRSSAVVRSVTVDVGSRVRQGQLLVSLESGDAGAALDAAEAEERLARKYHDRIAAIEKDGAATAQELDEARARLEMAEAHVREARTHLSYVRLVSPVAGVVTARTVDPGDLLVPGRPALTIAGDGDLVIEADLPAAESDGVAVGDPATVIEPRTASRHPARIARVVPALEGGSRRFRVEASLTGSASGLLPGAYVRLEFERPERSTLWIPEDAVVHKGQLTGAYLVRRDTVRLQWLRLGEVRASAVEVLAGVEAESRVVRRPPSTLVDGAKVTSVTVDPWSISGIESDQDR